MQNRKVHMARVTARRTGQADHTREGQLLFHPDTAVLHGALIAQDLRAHSAAAAAHQVPILHRQEVPVVVHHLAVAEALSAVAVVHRPAVAAEVADANHKIN
jgi:hypothetical protein